MLLLDFSSNSMFVFHAVVFFLSLPLWKKEYFFLTVIERWLWVTVSILLFLILSVDKSNLAEHYRHSLMVIVCFFWGCSFSPIKHFCFLVLKQLMCWSCCYEWQKCPSSSVVDGVARLLQVCRGFVGILIGILCLHDWLVVISRCRSKFSRQIHFRSNFGLGRQIGTSRSPDEVQVARWGPGRQIGI
jgi:hypothetical protein